MADTGHDVTDKAAVAGDSVSPFPSTQLPSATIPNPVSETASVVASLRMVCQKSDILCYILLKLAFILLFILVSLLDKFTNKRMLLSVHLLCLFISIP